MMSALLSRLFAAAAAGVLLASPLRAQTQAGNALTLLDAYLARAAVDTPAYRADLQAGGAPGRVPPGRLLGLAPLLGPFTYRPKTFGELTRAERAALLHDSRFHAFLIVRREQEDREGAVAPAAIPLSSRPQIEQFSVGPAEMLRPGPVFVALPPP